MYRSARHPHQRRVRPPWSGCLLFLFATAMVSVHAADTRTAKVNFTLLGTLLEVDDGDTLVMRGAGGGRFTIRLSDLDAPEIEHAKNPYRERRSCRAAPRRAAGQRDGEAARAALAQRAPRKAAVRAECYTIDRYGRPVCHVFAAGVNLNLEQLRDGWGMLPGNRAWQRDPASSAAEQAARSARRGIWSAARAERPERWRARCWCQGDCAARAR